MIASPSVWGRHRTSAHLTRVVIEYAAGMLVAACAVFGSLHGISTVLGTVPAWAVGMTALTSFAVARKVAMSQLPQSPWRVPRPETMSDRTYPIVFGAALGVGVITALPAVSFYTVLLSPLAAESLWAALGLGCAFAVARAVPMAWIAAHVSRAAGNPAAAMAARARLIKRFMAVEPSLLLLIAIVALAGQ